MFKPSLAVIGKSESMAANQFTGSSRHAARRFAPTTLRTRLYGLSTRVLRAVSNFMLSSKEPIPPRHLQEMMRLLRKAGEIESTQPDAAAELRWLALSSCYY